MHLYDRESANRLLPRLQDLLAQIVEKRRELAAIQRQLSGRAPRGQTPEVADDDGHLSRRFERLDAELIGLIEAVQDTGAVVKDLDMGLIDFPGVVDRQPVYLCWKLGEANVQYYHSVEEGYYGRKKLPDGP
jgi:hypothetical protein